MGAEVIKTKTYLHIQNILLNQIVEKLIKIKEQ